MVTIVTYLLCLFLFMIRQVKDQNPAFILDVVRTVLLPQKCVFFKIAKLSLIDELFEIELTISLKRSAPQTSSELRIEELYFVNHSFTVTMVTVKYCTLCINSKQY